jgi:hypothetical protein
MPQRLDDSQYMLVGEAYLGMKVKRLIIHPAGEIESAAAFPMTWKAFVKQI